MEKVNKANSGGNFKNDEKKNKTLAFLDQLQKEKRDMLYKVYQHDNYKSNQTSLSCRKCGDKDEEQKHLIVLSWIRQLFPSEILHVMKICLLAMLKFFQLLA